MAFRNIAVAVTATDAGLTSVLNRSGTTVDQFGRRVERSGRLVNTTTNGMSRSFSSLDNVISRGVNRSLTGFVAAAAGGYAAGRALNAGLQAVVGGAVQFDSRMRNVNSIAHLSEAQLHSLGNSVLDLSERLPQSANVLSEGLYDVESSGFAATQALIVTNAAGRAASAGLTDTATSAAAVSGVLNAYGEQAKDAQYVSDSLFQTVNVGVLSFADLAQGIGQVVGTAAAGKVDIDELGQAIATMTRGGIVPAEAFTSANQLLAQIIQPGEALAGVFHQLGYESGALALESKGLFGVMRDIQTVTGGDVTATSQLFTDIRSLRGALALGTDQGRLYASVVRDWSSAHEGAGATAAAFEEQQKAVSFQWQILKNEAKRTAISAGTEVLPDLIALMHGVERLGGVLANDGVRHTLEFAAAIFLLNKGIEAGIALRNSALITAVERQVVGSTAAAGAITAEGAAAVRTSAALGELALAENATAIAAGRLAVGGSVAGVAGATANLEGAGVAMGAGMAANMATGVSRALPTLLSTVLRRVLRGGVIALSGELVGGLIGGTTGGIVKDIGISAGVGSLAGPVGTLAGATFGASFGGTTALLHHFFGERFGDDPAKPVNLGASTHEVLDPLIAQYGNLDTALKVLQETNRETAETQRDLGISHNITTGSLEEELAALQELQKQRDEFTQQVQSAFFGAVDVTQQFHPEQGQQAVAAAQDRLLEANRALRQEQSQTASAVSIRKGHEQSVSETQQLADARRNVAQATQDLSDAQREAAQTGDLSTIYENNITAARRFVDNVRAAEERGLDPELIGRLLKQGPEQAGPLLDAIVSDHSGRMIELANTNERVLRRIGERTVRYAQFVNRAIHAPLEDQARLARELPNALRLNEALQNVPAPATGEWLAKQLGMTPPQIRRLARDFGISLPEFLQQTLDRHPVHVKVHFKMPPGYTQGPTGVFVPRGAAEGWHVQGPGTATSDSILARVSNGEFVVRAAAVNYYGADRFHALNKMTLPKYASGGMVGESRPVYGSGGLQPMVIVQPVTVPQSVSHTTRIDRASFDDTRAFDEFQRKQRARRAVEV